LHDVTTLDLTLKQKVKAGLLKKKSARFQYMKVGTFHERTKPDGLCVSGTRESARKRSPLIGRKLPVCVGLAPQGDL
jgi:hypothetical protein